VAGACECGNESSVPSNAVNFLTSSGPISFSGRICFMKLVICEKTVYTGDEEQPSFTGCVYNLIKFLYLNFPLCR